MLTHFSGDVSFLLPDGAVELAHCDARFVRERWQGTVHLRSFSRGLERGDVCRLVGDKLGNLRVVIIDQVASKRFEFVALVKPDPFEAL